MKHLYLILVSLLLPVFLYAAPGPILGADSVCIGYITTLSDATTGGTWVSSNTAVATVSGGNVSGLSVGTTTISYTVGGSTVTVVVTVNGGPASITGMTPLFCMSLPFDTMMNATAGGAWSLMPNTMDSISPSGMLRHRTTCYGCSGVENVIYTLPDGCSAYYVVTTNPAVSATVPSTICLGSTFTATGFPAGGTWSSGDTSIATISSSGLITGDTIGNVMITYMGTVGCAVYNVVSVVTPVVTHYVTSYADTICSAPKFTLYTSCDITGIITYFGDGSTDTATFSSGTTSVNVYPHYTLPGTYYVTQVLYSGAAIDTISFSYEYLYCSTLPIKIFNDNNANCIFDSGDHYNYLPIAVQVDSNGTPVDTLTGTSGIYYFAYGPPGTIYSFSIISTPGSLVESCPASNVIYDTITAYVNTYIPKYFGLTCAGLPGYDLSAQVTGICGRHHSFHNILAENSYCSSGSTVAPVVTMTFSPKYNFTSAIPAPSSIAGNVLTWNLDSLSAMSSTPELIATTFDVPGAYLIPGDTILSKYHIGPTIGDVDTFNNNVIVVDTVKLGYDPNEMAVSPEGYILAGTHLLYSINFENTGNDTAFDIYVMDTLSPNVDIHSFKIEGASAAMNILQFQAGGNNIVKFDFPNINLLDSSHHNRCDGMLTFSINTYSGLPFGTTIFNHAGIFFDDNPVVMTNTVEDIIGTPLNVTPVNTALVRIFPNPADDAITIQVTPGTYTSYTITNTIGQQMLQGPLTAAKTGVHVKQLPAGVYYITLTGDNGPDSYREVQKFVKM